MTDRDVLASIKETFRAELGRCANEEIEKLVHKFVCEMGKHKAELIAKIIERVEIIVSENPMHNKIEFQIIIGGAEK